MGDVFSTKELIVWRFSVLLRFDAFDYIFSINTMELSISLSLATILLPMISTMDAFIVAQSSLRERAGGIFTSRNVTVRIFCPSRSSSVDGEI